MKPIHTQPHDTETPLHAWRALLAAARPHHAFASLLARRGAQLFSRFTHFYRQLHSLPRRLRRALHARLGRSLAASFLGAALLLAFNPARSAHAATITVEAGCTLPQAIITANNGSAQGSCALGDAAGPDTIVLTGDVTLSAQLPAVQSQITVAANGHTITGSGDARVFEVYYGDLTLDDAIITGGAVDLDESLPELYRTGGAIYNYDGTVTVNDSTLTANSALYGGALFNYGPDAVMTVNRSTISGNAANQVGAEGGMGGAVYNGGGATLTFNNSTISGNQAPVMGGGIANNATLTMRNSTVTGNTGGEGGGVYLFNGDAVLSRSIISGNTATDAGHEIWTNNFPGGVTVDQHNVFGYGGDARSHNFTPGASDVVPAAALGAILDTSLAANGGPTFTHALVAGSPAIDLAPDAACLAAPIDGIDQRGVARNIDGDDAGASGTECDAGAYEYEGDPTAIRLQTLTARITSTNPFTAALAALTTLFLTLLTAAHTRQKP